MFSKIFNSISLNNWISSDKPKNIFKPAYKGKENSNFDTKNKHRLPSAKKFTPLLTSTAELNGNVNNIVYLVCIIEEFNKYPRILAQHAKNVERLDHELIQATYAQKLAKRGNFKFFGFTFFTTKRSKDANRNVRDLTEQLQAARVEQSEARKNIPPEYLPLLDPDDDIHSKRFIVFLNNHVAPRPQNVEDIIETQEKYCDAAVKFEQISNTLPVQSRLFINPLYK